MKTRKQIHREHLVAAKKRHKKAMQNPVRFQDQRDEFVAKILEFVPDWGAGSGLKLFKYKF